MAAKTASEKMISRNWGYWDGVSARERGRFPLWAKSHQYRPAHPFDRYYGEGFWIGFYNEEPPKGAIVKLTA